MVDFRRKLVAVSLGRRERERGTFGKICLEIRCLCTGVRYRSIKRRIYGPRRNDDGKPDVVRWAKGRGVERTGAYRDRWLACNSDSSRAQPFYIPACEFVRDGTAR